jgi:hypothetical protein
VSRYAGGNGLLGKKRLLVVYFLQVDHRLLGDDIELADIDRSCIAVEREHIALVKPTAAETAGVPPLCIDVQIAPLCTGVPPAPVWPPARLRSIRKRMMSAYTSHVKSSIPLP